MITLKNIHDSMVVRGTPELLSLLDKRLWKNMEKDFSDPDIYIKVTSKWGTYEVKVQ